jgi:hypothetical protein
MGRKLEKTRDILGTTVIVGGTAFMVGRYLLQAKFDEFLGKTVHVEVADDAPAVVKTLLGKMDLSVRMIDLYARATSGEPSPLQRYFKITVR